MASHYRRLHRYQQSASRSPLEDFATEALADLLERMPREIVVDLVGELFMSAGRPRADWRVLGTRAKTLSWTTQHPVRSGDASYRADLVLEADSRPILVVEMKIHAALQHHVGRDDTDQEISIKRNQLQTYGRWIAGVQPDATWPGAIALLTLGTKPPDDFEQSGENGYGTRWRQTVRWPAVWRGH